MKRSLCNATRTKQILEGEMLNDMKAEATPFKRIDTSNKRRSYIGKH
jgi:hypothetical protein